MALSVDKDFDKFHLYILIYDVSSNELIKYKEKLGYEDLFFDILYVSDIEKALKELETDLDVKKYIPFDKIFEIYNELEENKKSHFVFDGENCFVFNLDEVDRIPRLQHINKQHFYPKEFIYHLISIFDDIKESKIQPIYIPTNDKEKHLSFTYEKI